MANCSRCGSQIPQNYKFCPKCGTPIQVINNGIPTNAPRTNYVPTYGSPTNNAPTYAPRTNSAPTYAPPTNNAPTYAPRTNGAPTYSQPTNSAPTYAQPTNRAQTYAQPTNSAQTYAPRTNGAPTYAPPTNKAQTYGSPSNDIPTFTPPTNNIPTFTPPSQPSRYNNGPVCYHHPDEPAAGQCVRCGKYICSDCVEAYTVTEGEYANQSLCYDCCQELVAENVRILKKQKAKIIALFIATLIGMTIGAMFFAESTVAGVICMFWFGSFWWWIKNTFSTWWNNPAGRSFWGFIGAGIGGLIIAPVKTIIKIVQCIVYLTKTSRFIKEDSEALVQMREYMEYTQVMSRNKGVDLETLMSQGSELYNNSYAQMVSTQGEAAADAMIRHYTTRIAENGEIIRDFAA